MTDRPLSKRRFVSSWVSNEPLSIGGETTQASPKLASQVAAAIQQVDELERNDCST